LAVILSLNMTLGIAQARPETCGKKVSKAHWKLADAYKKTKSASDLKNLLDKMPKGCDLADFGVNLESAKPEAKPETNKPTGPSLDDLKAKLYLPNAGQWLEDHKREMLNLATLDKAKNLVNQTNKAMDEMDEDAAATVDSMKVGFADAQRKVETDRKEYAVRFKSANDRLEQIRVNSLTSCSLKIADPTGLATANAKVAAYDTAIKAWPADTDEVKVDGEEMDLQTANKNLRKYKRLVAKHKRTKQWKGCSKADLDTITNYINALDAVEEPKDQADKAKVQNLLSEARKATDPRKALAYASMTYDVLFPPTKYKFINAFRSKRFGGRTILNEENADAWGPMVSLGVSPMFYGGDIDTDTGTVKSEGWAMMVQLSAQYAWELGDWGHFFAGLDLSVGQATFHFKHENARSKVTQSGVTGMLGIRAGLNFKGWASAALFAEYIMKPNGAMVGFEAMFTKLPVVRAGVRVGYMYVANASCAGLCESANIDYSGIVFSIPVKIFVW